jgi:glycerol-3-phosphate O-acyltransferase
LVLRPFIDAYRVVAEELINLDPQRAVDEKQFFDRCLRLAKQWSLQRRIASKESVSQRTLVQQLDDLQKSIETLAAFVRNRGFSRDVFSPLNTFGPSI